MESLPLESWRVQQAGLGRVSTHLAPSYERHAYFWIVCSGSLYSLYSDHSALCRAPGQFSVSVA